MSLTRGCGKRKAGGMYLELGTSECGRPLESFILCPPVPVNETWGVTPVNTRLIGNAIFDWVGEGYWPNVCDYLEEVRAFGVSARLPTNLDLRKLTEAPVFYPIHARGLLLDWWQYPNRQRSCPNHAVDHSLGDGPCAGWWWEDVVGGKEVDKHFYLNRPTLRETPSVMYTANARPKDLDEGSPKYAPAVIAVFPCSRIVVVKGDEHPGVMAKAMRASHVVPVLSVDE